MLSRGNIRRPYVKGEPASLCPEYAPHRNGNFCEPITNVPSTITTTATTTANTVSTTAAATRVPDISSLVPVPQVEYNRVLKVHQFTVNATQHTESINESTQVPLTHYSDFDNEIAEPAGSCSYHFCVMTIILSVLMSSFFV